MTTLHPLMVSKVTDNIVFMGKRLFRVGGTENSDTSRTTKTKKLKLQSGLTRWTPPVLHAHDVPLLAF